jgi:hypothetical protein
VDYRRSAGGGVLLDMSRRHCVDRSGPSLELALHPKLNLSSSAVIVKAGRPKWVSLPQSSPPTAEPRGRTCQSLFAHAGWTLLAFMVGSAGGCRCWFGRQIWECKTASLSIGAQLQCAGSEASDSPLPYRHIELVHTGEAGASSATAHLLRFREGFFAKPSRLP